MPEAQKDFDNSNTNKHVIKYDTNTAQRKQENCMAQLYDTNTTSARDPHDTNTTLLKYLCDTNPRLHGSRVTLNAKSTT